MGTLYENLHFPLSKKNSFRGNYTQKYGILHYCGLNNRKVLHTALKFIEFVKGQQI